MNGETLMVATAVLLLALLSLTANTLNCCCSVPTVLACKTTVAVVCCPFSNTPMVQASWLPVNVQMSDETKLTDAGSKLVICTPPAADGPLLTTVSVTVTHSIG